MIDAIEKEKVHLSPFNLEIHVIFDSMNNDRKENSIECLIWSVLQWGVSREDRDCDQVTVAGQLSALLSAEDGDIISNLWTSLSSTLLHSRLLQRNTS